MTSTMPGICAGADLLAEQDVAPAPRRAPAGRPGGCRSSPRRPRAAAAAMQPVGHHPGEHRQQRRPPPSPWPTAARSRRRPGSARPEPPSASPIGIIVDMKSTSVDRGAGPSPGEQVADPRANTTTRTRASPPNVAPPWLPPRNSTIARPTIDNAAPGQGPRVRLLAEEDGAGRHEEQRAEGGDELGVGDARRLMAVKKSVMLRPKNSPAGSTARHVAALTVRARPVSGAARTR